jgi:undecaprenyl-diphosphatase
VPSALGRRAGVLLACGLALLGLMVGLGMAVTKVLFDNWPLTQEDEASAALAAERTPMWDDVSAVVSQAANTGVIVATTLVVALTFRLAFGRWRESVFLIVAVGVQASVFLLTTLAIDRERPDVTHLDEAPPTSSFPSGHTGAATALCISIAVVLAWHTRHRWVRALVIALLVLAPMAVAVARLYRGMHHPSDVLASFLNGGLSSLIAARVTLRPERGATASPEERVSR